MKTSIINGVPVGKPTFAIHIHGRFARHSLSRLRDALIDGRRSSFALLSTNGSIDFLTMKDQIDVGVSAPLQSGLGLFDPLHAVSPGPALRWACLGTAKAGLNSTAFPCSTSVTGWVRSTLYTGGAISASGHVRKPEPDRLPFGPSLDQPRLACSL